MTVDSEQEAINVSVVIVSYNTCDLTRQCLERVEEYAAEISCEVFVVDNASTDGSAAMVASRFPWVKLIELPENRGFAGGNNPAMRKASGRYVLLLNSDAFLDSGVLSKTIKHMDRHPDIGILGCRLTNADGSMQPSARMLPSPLNKLLHITGLAARFPRSRFWGRVDFSWWDHSQPRSVGWVVGAYFLIRKKVMEDIGYLDERYFLYFEEIDYCLSARRAGWDVVFYPHAAVVHLGGQSAAKSNATLSSKGRQMIGIRLTSEFRYYRKCYGLVYVWIAALIESVWNLVIWGRNLIRSGAVALERREAARRMIQLVIQTLRNDHWGRGPEPL